LSGNEDVAQYVKDHALEISEKLRLGDARKFLRAKIDAQKIPVRFKEHLYRKYGLGERRMTEDELLDEVIRIHDKRIKEEGNV